MNETPAFAGVPEKQATAIRSATMRTAAMRTKDQSLRIFAGGLILALAWIVILYYIWGPSRGYLHSDSTDTILWAQESLESGRVFNPDFHYAALLPFGASLWYVPLLAIGGYQLSTQLLGMTVFLLVLTASLVFLFRSLSWSWGESLGASGLILLLVSGSDKLRELFWGHTIYYSLGLVLLSVGLGLVLRCFQGGQKQKLWAVLLLLFSAGAATNGTQIMALYFVPLMGALILEAFLPAKQSVRREYSWKNVYPALLVFVGTIAGLMILLFLRRGGINAGYAEAYTMWSDSSKWAESFRNILSDYLTLFGAESKGTTHLFSLDSILLLASLLSALVVLFLPVLQLIRYKHIRSGGTRLLLLVHTVQSALLIFLYIFSKLSYANWRLTPLLSSSVVTSLVICRDWLKVALAKAAPTQVHTAEVHSAEPSQERRWGIVLLAVICLGACSNAVKIVQIPPNYGQGLQIDQDLTFMKNNNLDYGYGSFWQSQIYTLMSDSETKVRPVEIDEKGLYLRDYQNKASWYENQAADQSFFLIVTSSELEKLQQSADWALLVPRIVQEMQVGTHRFLLLNGDIADLLKN